VKDLACERKKSLVRDPDPSPSAQDDNGRAFGDTKIPQHSDRFYAIYSYAVNSSRPRLSVPLNWRVVRLRVSSTKISYHAGSNDVWMTPANEADASWN
jgi:hypothetical protein